MAQTATPVNGKAAIMSAVRYTDPRTGDSYDYLVDDVFPARNDRGMTYMLVRVDTGKYARNDLTDTGWNFV